MEHSLVKCESWKKIFLEFPFSQDYLIYLNQKQQKKFARALMLSTDALSKEDVNFYIDKIMNYIVGNMKTYFINFLQFIKYLVVHIDNDSIID